MPTTPHKVDGLPKTRLAFLATIGNLHAESLRYDLDCLSTIILKLAPDLLCTEVTRDDWESSNLSDVAPELREALAPAITLTDAVLVPIAPSPSQFSDYQGPAGFRHWLSQWFDRLLRWGQRKANGPEAIHGLVFETFCHTVCALTEMTWTEEDRSTWDVQNEVLVENILKAIHRDPGRRVLVIVQCQRIHKMEPLLKKNTARIEIVDYRDL